MQTCFILLLLQFYCRCVDAYNKRAYIKTKFVLFYFYSSFSAVVRAALIVEIVASKLCVTEIHSSIHQNKCRVVISYTLFVYQIHLHNV